MASIIQKVRTITLSNIHGLLDKVIDLDSIGAVKQYIRDLEGSIEDLETSWAEAEGYLRSLTRKQTELQAASKELDNNIDLLLTDADPSNDPSATTLQAKFEGYQKTLVDLEQQVPEARKVVDQLDQAISQLKTKHADMVAQIGRLQAMDQAAKAKMNAARSLESAGAAASDGADVSIDDVAAGIQRKADVSDARFERAMGSMADSVDKDVAIAQAQAGIEARKQRLGLSSTPAEEAPTTAPAG